MKRLLRSIVFGLTAFSFLACSVPPIPTAQAPDYSQTVEGLYVYSLIEEDHEKLEVNAVKKLGEVLAMSNLKMASVSGEADVPEQKNQELESLPDTVSFDGVEAVSSEMFAAAGEAGTSQVLVIRQRENGIVRSSSVAPTATPGSAGFMQDGRRTRFDVTLHDVRREEVVWRAFVHTVGNDNTGSKWEGHTLAHRIVELLVRDGLMPASVLKALQASVRVER